MTAMINNRMNGFSTWHIALCKFPHACFGHKFPYKRVFLYIAPFPLFKMSCDAKRSYFHFNFPPTSSPPTLALILVLLTVPGFPIFTSCL